MKTPYFLRHVMAFTTLFATTCLATGPAARPNIVLIVVDTLRYDHMSQAGYRHPTSPALDALAAEGARFTKSFSTSGWTLSSVMSLFTSLHVAQHGVLTLDQVLPDNATTLAAELRKTGYQTAGFTASPFTHSRFGFGRGFELYDDYTILLGANLLEPGATPVKVNYTPTAESLTQLAISWLDTSRKSEQPFFMEVMYFDPHADYMPPSKYARLFTNPNYLGSQRGRDIPGLALKYVSPADREQVIGLYDGEIRYTDESVGVLLDHLRKLNLMDNTLVVVTADHGEELWEHGRVTHGHSLHDEIVQIPLIMRYPPLVKPGTVISNQVSLLDIMPTLLSASASPASSQCRGRDLTPLLTGQPQKFEDRILFFEMHSLHEVAAARTPELKLIINLRGPQQSMYDLTTDPTEQQDLARTPRRKEFDTLLGQLVAWTNSMPTHVQTRKAVIDAPLMEQLRSLGYTR